jgi:hypothetical protein
MLCSRYGHARNLRATHDSRFGVLLQNHRWQGTACGDTRSRGEEVGNAGHGMALKELFTGNPIWGSHQRARTALQGGQQPAVHRFTVSREI